MEWGGAMDTFSIRDLRERTGDLVRAADSGQLSVVTSHGRPVFVAVPFSDALMKSGADVALAARLFQDKVLGLGRAAKLAGQPKLVFIETLGRMGIPVVDYPPSEIAQELEILGA
jgi:prevent-host-death family protein